MKLGVMSDSHDQVENILKAVEIFNQEKVELVIHCGDWVSPFTLKFYEKLQCPIKGVFGNNDGDKFRHLERKRGGQYQVDVTYFDLFMELEIDGKKIAAFHGDSQPILRSLIKSQNYDVIFHGHTHQKINEVANGTLSFNPGTLMKNSGNVQGASIGIYDTIKHSARHIDL